MTILYFIIGLGLLIFIHELGHFLVAKASGIRVERFSLGFGPRIIKFNIGETEYCISALPLGGYVKMSGQEDFEEGEILPLDDPRAFSSKSIWVRLQVVLAGPFMNLLLPFILMPIVFMLGRVEPKFLPQAPVVMGVRQDSPAHKAGIQKGDLILEIDGHPVADWNELLRDTAKPAGTRLAVTWQHQSEKKNADLELIAIEGGNVGVLGVEPIFFFDVEPVIGEFAPDSAAESAGMKAGDKVVAINGEALSDWSQMSDKVNGSKGQALKFTVERGGQKVDLSISPVFNPTLKKFAIGVSKASNPDLYENQKYGFVDAVEKGAKENVVLLEMTFKVLKDLITLKASYKELGGPVRIAQISAKAAEKGMGNFIYLLAFLSIQLGVLNLLPIPVLDGGHIAFMLYEAMARKPLSMKTRLIAQQVGMFLLLTLMILVTINDIDSVWGFHQMFDKVKSWF